MKIEIKQSIKVKEPILVLPKENIERNRSMVNNIKKSKSYVNNFLSIPSNKLRLGNTTQIIDNKILKKPVNYELPLIKHNVNMSFTKPIKSHSIQSNNKSFKTKTLNEPIKKSNKKISVHTKPLYKKEFALPKKMSKTPMNNAEKKRVMNYWNTSEILSSVPVHDGSPTFKKLFTQKNKEEEKGEFARYNIAKGNSRDVKKLRMDGLSIENLMTSKGALHKLWKYISANNNIKAANIKPT